MVQDKVTRKEVRDIQVGQTSVFNLATPKKVTSARVTCRQMMQEEGTEYIMRPDYKAVAISITRIK